jgi:hypothetical protein
MSPPQWHKLPPLDRAALHEARLQAHHAAQWLARTARAFVPPQPNDGHTNLGWDGALGGLTTHALKQGSVLGLDIGALTLKLWDAPGQAGLQTMSLDGRRDADVRAWLGAQLKARGLDAAALDAPSPYAMPDHPIEKGAAYAGSALAGPLAALVAWFANGHGALQDTLQPVLARGIAAPPVRCWPHHFDLDSLLSLGAGDAARTVGLGFCPGDDYYDEPYFYISTYPPPDVATLPALPAVGHWHTHHFTAAVAEATRIVAASDPQAATEAFLRAAVGILVP